MTHCIYVIAYITISAMTSICRVTLFRTCRRRYHCAVAMSERRNFFIRRIITSRARFVCFPTDFSTCRRLGFMIFNNMTKRRLYLFVAYMANHCIRTSRFSVIRWNTYNCAYQRLRARNDFKISCIVSVCSASILFIFDVKFITSNKIYSQRLPRYFTRNLSYLSPVL